ncbi:MAG TPA: glycine/betaine/sarcosine/D-proline family reductase selenoprotein B [Pyrinomonadaceae bacterium]|jgi:D-proline reductase (dithiol) PrdB
MAISRKCVPFTPFDGELAKATIAIVTAGGVHLKDQEPFNTANELGDLTYRVIPLDVDSSELMVSHHHYDHTDADRDINVVFPIDALRDLMNEGLIGGIAKKHIGYMGYTMQLKAMYEGTAPEIANEIDRGSRADAVILTGGCPNVCHRTVVAVQREIEMKGIPTVLITVSPEVSAQMRPPRSLYPEGFKIGNSLGKPCMRELQRKVLRDALGLLKENTRPGEFVTRSYPEYGEYHEPSRVRAGIGG